MKRAQLFGKTSKNLLRLGKKYKEFSESYRSPGNGHLFVLGRRN
jgi:hypothetical protein